MAIHTSTYNFGRTKQPTFPCILNIRCGILAVKNEYAEPTGGNRAGLQKAMKIGLFYILASSHGLTRDGVAPSVPVPGLLV